MYEDEGQLSVEIRLDFITLIHNIETKHLQNVFIYETIYSLFSYNSIFYKNVEPKMRPPKEHAKNMLRLRKGEELLCWILHKIMESIGFSASVRQCNIS